MSPFVKSQAWELVGLNTMLSWLVLFCRLYHLSLALIVSNIVSS